MKGIAIHGSILMTLLVVISSAGAQQPANYVEYVMQSGVHASASLSNDLYQPITDYHALYRQAVRRQNTGIMLAVAGGCCLVGGSVILAGNHAELFETGNYITHYNGGLVLFMSGAALLPVGITQAVVWSGKKRLCKTETGKQPVITRVSVGIVPGGAGIFLDF